MVYTIENDVYKTTGFSSEVIQTLSKLSAAEVSTLVAGWISDAEDEINGDIGLPDTIRKELHLGDGDSNIFDLGPQDEHYVSLGDFDPTGGVTEIFEVLFGGQRMLRPYPHDCDEFTEFATTDLATAAWSGSGATITAETTKKVAGSYGIKTVFANAGYIQYPKTGYINRSIDMFTDFFCWLETTDKTTVITVRLYDKDGNYKEETITPNFNSFGEYHWLNIDSFTDGGGGIDWFSSNLQYIRIYVDKGCTIYLDNLCFADSWAFTAPLGKFHTSVAENITGETGPGYGYPFTVTYGYNPALPNVPGNLKKACEWLVGVYAIEYLRGIKWAEVDFRLMSDSLEPDTPMQKSALLGLRDKWLQNYQRCLTRYGGKSYGTVG